MKTSSRSNRRAQLAFGSAIFALLLVSAVSYRGIVVSGASERWVRHSHQVLQTLQDLRFAIASLQSNCRGFVLTGEEPFLLAYQSSGLRMRQDQTALRELTADNPEQRRRLPLLESLGNQEIEHAEMVMDHRRKQGMESAISAMRNRPDQQIVGDFQTVIGQVQDEEMRLLILRNGDAQRHLRQIKMLLVLGTVLGLMMAAAAAWDIRRRNSGRGQAEEALRDSEEKYRMLLDGVQDHAIFMLDPQGQIMSWNAGAGRIQGYASEEIIGRNFSCFFPEEDIQRGRPPPCLLLRLPAAGTKNKACGCEKMAHGSWPMLPALRCSNREELCADFPRSAAISARVKNLELSTGACSKRLLTPWSWSIRQGRLFCSMCRRRNTLVIAATNWSDKK